MTLGAPWWLLLLALGALLVYFHRQRRAARAAEVGSVHLWRRLAVASSARARPRPRASAALLLQALVLLLVTLALARPALDAPARGSSGVVLLEAGRAMRATDVQPDRFHAAARAAVAQLPARSTVLLVAGVPRPLAVDRRDHAGVRAALADATASDAAPDWTAAARMLRDLGLAAGPVTVYASPGGAADAARALAGVDADIRTVGAGAPNAALAALTVTPGAAGSPWTVHVRVRQHGPAAPRRVTVTLDGVTLAERRVDLAADADTPLDVRFTPGAGGVLTARLDGADVLPADDRAHVVLHPTPPAVRIVRVGARPAADDPLGRALAAVPGATVTTRADLPPPGVADVLVVSGVGSAPPDDAPVSVWLPAPDAPTTPARVLGWDAGDPLGYGGAWSDLGPQARVAAPAWPGAHALLSGTGGPLLEVRRAAGRTAVRVLMPATPGRWTDSPAFPVLFARLAALARPDAGARVVPPCTVGLPCALPAGTRSVRTPDGRAQPAVGESFVPWHAGEYRAGPTVIAVNRLAGPDAQLGTAAARPDRAPGAGWRLPGADVWRALLAAALVALVVEFVLLTRREPALRRRRLAALRGPQRRMLALHAASAALLAVAVLDVRVPGPTRPPQAVPVAATAGDLAAALEVAAARVPAGTAADLRVPGGPWRVSARLPDVLARVRAGGMGVTVEAAPPAAPLGIVAFDVPARVSPGQTFDAHVVLRAAAPGSVRVRLRRRDTPVLDAAVTVRAGLNRVAVPLREQTPGPVGYTLSVAGPEASAAATATAATAVEALPAVLVVGEDTPARAALVRAVAVQDLAARAVTPAALRPEDVAGSARTVLLDTPAGALTPPLRAALHERVTAGGHLLIAGDARAFGPGGYVGTTLEGLSPLSGRVPRDLPRLALALVLDKSGSMNETVGGGLTKLDLIKSAALNSALLLSPQSDVTVIAFDSSPKVAVPLGPAADTARIRAQISRIEAEGGTVVKRALDAALKELLKSGAARRHLILLTDGVDGGIFSPDEYRRVIRRMLATGITVSTVSVGSGMHVPLMRSMAEWGEGRFAQAQDWRDVPSLMARDTLDLGEDAVKTGTFPARFPGTAGVTLDRYVRTTVKPGATPLGTVGTGPDADPLAATWRSGLGSVTALAVNPTGSPALSGRADFPALLGPLVRGTPLPGADPGRVVLDRDGADLLVSAPTPTVTVSGPDGPWPLTLSATPDGRYATRVYAPTPGGYSAPGAAVGVPGPTRDPAALDLADPAAGAGGGWTWGPAWPALAVLALLAFLAGLAVRYLPERGDPRPAGTGGTAAA